MIEEKTKFTDGNKLKKLRDKNALTQEQLADKLKVSKALIAAIESGERRISFKLSDIIHEIFETNILEDDFENNGKLNNIIPIPFYSAKASAKCEEVLSDYPEKDVMYFDKRWLKNVLGVNTDNLSIIQAKGNSMDGGLNPIKDGDLLLIDESVREPVNRQIFVVQIDNLELVVKRTDVEWDGTVKLCSNNPEFGNDMPKDKAVIIGRVIWNGSKKNV